MDEKERFLEKHREKFMCLVNLVNGMTIYEMKLMFALCEDLTNMTRINPMRMIDAMKDVIQGE